MTRATFTAAALVLLAVAALTAGAAGVRPATASAASRNCNAPAYPGSGYFTSLRVSRVSCATGGTLIKAHYACRTRHGRTGHCGRIRGYRCSERREAIPTEYDASVTCKRGGGRVVRYTYQQNT